MLRILKEKTTNMDLLLSKCWKGLTVEMAGSSDNKKKIYVGGLPLHLTNKELKKYFESFGMVTMTKIKNRGALDLLLLTPWMLCIVLQRRDHGWEGWLWQESKADIHLWL